MIPKVTLFRCAYLDVFLASQATFELRNFAEITVNVLLK